MTLEKTAISPRPAKRVLIMGSQARAMANFWQVLIKSLIARGHEVICLNPEAKDQADQEAARVLRGLGASVVFFPMQRKGTNPLADLASMAALYRIFREQ